MKLIVGLGNPGLRYQMTRHNIGFMVVDAISHTAGQGAFKTEHKALTEKIQLAGAKVLIAKPQTYMNLSGESIRPLMDYYGIELDDVLVIHDDIDQPFAGIRFHKKRGHGGHNGIRSLHQHLGTDDYARLKLGVSRPSHAGQAVADYVLSDFSKQEQSELADFLSDSVHAVEVFIQEGYTKAANQFNGRNRDA